MKSLIQLAIFSLFILSICYNEIIAVDSPCGDWEPFKDEKCFKIFDKLGLQTYNDAENTCRQQENGSDLISIHFLEEQEFISNLFKTHKVINNVWIGAKYTSNKYKWTDDSDLVFTKWEEGSPKNKTGNCVQFLSDGTSFGKWSDVPCDLKNQVVCQKMQTLSLQQLQKILFDVKKNPVPIGFIYVQLPHEKSPHEIWPWMTWNDITSVYAGHFFRAEGGGSEAFGETQDDDAPRLSNISVAHGQLGLTSAGVHPGIWSEPVLTGKLESPQTNLRFLLSFTEVRPRNMAIRIWKRAG